MGIITLKPKISQKSVKQVYWEPFTASERPAWIWLMRVSSRLTERTVPPNPGEAPPGTVASALSQDSHAMGLGGSQLLSSSQKQARKQASDLWEF